MNYRKIKELFSNHFVLSVIAGAVIVLLVSTANAATHKADMKFTESGTDLDRVSIENVNGEIEVTGTDGSTVEITAHIKIEGDSDEIEKYAEEFVPKISRSDGRLMIETEFPDDHKDYDDIDHSSISYDVKLPKNFGVDIESVNGDIKVMNTYGILSVEVVNGDIEIICNKGNSQDVSVESVNGDVAISLKKLMNDCDYESVNGDFTLTITDALEGDIDIETVNGDIEINIPESASVAINASSAMGGDIETDWGDGEGITFMTGEEFEYKVKDGKYKLDIETVNGEIEIHHID